MKKELALGMMRLPVDGGKKIDFKETNRLVDYFLEQGFRKFDTAELYHDTLSEHAVRDCIVKRHKRDSFEIADKLTSWRIPEGMTAEDFFRKQLEVTQAEYFDRYLLHSVEPEIFKTAEEKGYFDFIFQKKAEGIVREAGFSFHGLPELLDQVLTKYPETDFVQLQINYIDWDNLSIRSRECYETARKHGKKVLIMEPVKGGLLANLPAEGAEILKSAAPERSIASWALRFAAGLDGVDTVLSGISNMEQMIDNTELMKNFEPLSDEELKVLGKLRAYLTKIPMVECTGCGYCLSACPLELPISGYIKVLNNAQLFGKADGVVHSYRWLTAKHKPSDCVKCECCTGVCPQHLDIPGHLARLAGWAERNGL
ncbi:MAG: aldo/keto reductase [Lentisphaeria bacterium]|nr:aldo/keto reductase [Lentisphaeria bacterium]